MNTRHILIAEDEMATRRSVGIILEGAGYKTSAVKNGSEALQRILALYNTHERVDLLLTDIQMGEMDGLELMDELKRRGIQVPTIVVTGYGDRATLVRLLRRGCVDYLDKPVTPGTLVSKVQSVFENQFIEHKKKSGKSTEMKSRNEDLVHRLEAYRQRLEELRRKEKSTGCEEAPVGLWAKNQPLETVFRHRPHPDGNRDFLAIRKTRRGCNLLMAKRGAPQSDFPPVLRAFFEESCESGEDGGVFFNVLNRHLLQTGEGEPGLMGLFISLNLENMTGSVVSADHPFPIQLRAALPIPIFLMADGCALGLHEGASFESRLFRIEAGDRFFLLSDRPDGHELPGDMSENPSERLGAILRKIVARERDLSLKTMVTESWKEILQTRNGNPREDLLLLGFEIAKE